MSSPKQMMDFKPVKSVDANVSNEHQRNWSNELFERKAKNPDHNYDRSRTALNFQVGPGGMITTVDKSRRIGDWVDEIIKKRLRQDSRVTAISNRAVMVVFGGNRERMREMAFGSQVLNEYEETNGHLIRQPEIEQWAKDIHETGARHRSTAEYNRDLHRENARLETLISDKSGQLGRLEDQIKKAETRVKGLSTMITNLERQEAELNDEIAQLETDIENGAGDVSELRCRIASLEAQLETTGQKLADKRDKLKLADRQLAELQDELDALSEKRDNAQKNFHEFTEKNQEQIRMRLTDAVFARMVVDVRSLLDAMPSELKADFDGEFLTAIAEQPNDILKCAMYLFLGYLDGATQFAQSCGSGGGDTSLPWGRKDDEDDRRFAYRCMIHAYRMMKPSQPKRGISGRR